MTKSSKTCTEWDWSPTEIVAHVADPLVLNLLADGL